MAQKKGGIKLKQLTDVSPDDYQVLSEASKPFAKEYKRASIQMDVLVNETTGVRNLLSSREFIFLCRKFTKSWVSPRRRIMM